MLHNAQIKAKILEAVTVFKLKLITTLLAHPTIVQFINIDKSMMHYLQHSQTCVVWSGCSNGEQITHAG